jgi:hypothetical protein
LASSWHVEGEKNAAVVLIAFKRESESRAASPFEVIEDFVWYCDMLRREGGGGANRRHG